MACRCGGQGCCAAAHGWVAAGANVYPVVDERARGVVDTDCTATGKGTVADRSAAEVLGEAGVKAVRVFELGGAGLMALFFYG